MLIKATSGLHLTKSGSINLSLACFFYVVNLQSLQPTSAISVYKVSNQNGDNMSEDKFRTEEFRVDGEELIAKVKNIINEGNIRRVIIKNKDGKIIFEIPLTFGVVGALIAPQLAALGAIAALLSEATVVVEKSD